MIALLADPLWLALISALGLARALTSRKATPLDAVLGRIPWPGRRTPRSGARNDTRSRSCAQAVTAAQDGATGDCTRDNPRAAGGASARGAQPSGRRTTILDILTAPLRLLEATGQHCAAVLEVRFDVGGERADGTWVHGATGPMPALTDEQLWREIERTRSPA